MSLRRTPLLRRTGLSPGTKPLRRSTKPIRASTPEHRASSRAFRQAVLLRDPVCRLCGVAPSVDAHHILPKGRGGSDNPENGAGLDRKCHDYITHTVQGQRLARSLGLTVGKELPAP